MRLDAHQHFWRYSSAEYPWIGKGTPLERDCLPEHLAPELSRSGLDGSIAVQARQTLEESRWLLGLAAKSRVIKGVVGWVDLRNADVGNQLAEFSGNSHFRGVRHVVQDEPDADFVLGAEFQRGIAQLHDFGLTYDLLIYPRQLPAAIQLVRIFPNQAFVLDHLAKPPIKLGTLSPWREQIEELAKAPNVLCKVSGMVTEADHETWQANDFRPYLEIALEAFGEDRLMYGSDWPVCLLAGTYERVFTFAHDFFGGLSPAVQAKIFGGNAARFYGIAQSG